MNPYKKLFLLYGTIFAAGGVVIDAVKGESLADWWANVLSAYVGAGIGALLLYKLSRRKRPDS